MLQDLQRERRVGLEQELTRSGVDQILGQDALQQVAGIHLHLYPLLLGKLVLEIRGELEASEQRGLRGSGTAFGRRSLLLRSQNPVVQLQGGLAAQVQGEGVIEALQELGVGFQAKGPQKHGTRKAPLAVNAHVEDLLLIELKLDPRAAVGHHLGQKGGGGFIGKGNPGGAVQLGNHHPFRAVDDERAGGGHQRQLAKVQVLLLDVADLALRPFFKEHQAHPYLERHRVGETPFPAIILGELDLEAHRRVTGGAAGDGVDRGLPAVGTHGGELVRFRRLNAAAAVLAVDPQVLETRELAALAFPDAQLVVDEMQLTGGAEVGEGKNRGENRLQPYILALLRQQVHLQKLVVAGLLHGNEVGKRDGRANL
ncbi:hypothetical protein HRbin09_01682 [bacterium HR09]|nr:hypothetical protein HRbin09_01682 [bacterium HR09]